MLLKHYLDRGVSKAELSRRFGMNRRTIHNWVDTGQLDRDLAAGARGYAPRPPVRLRTTRPRPDARWHLDEVFVSVAGKRMYLWCACRTIPDFSEHKNTISQC